MSHERSALALPSGWAFLTQDTQVKLLSPWSGLPLPLFPHERNALWTSQTLHDLGNAPRLQIFRELHADDRKEN